MLTKVQKWGNSLALRIPKAFAQDAQLENDSLGGNQPCRRSDYYYACRSTQLDTG